MKSNDTSQPNADLQRPMRDLLLLMPHMQARMVGNHWVIDWASAEGHLLLQISTNAEIALKTIQQGTAVIGRLLAHASPEIGCGEFSASEIEALGWLINEANDFSSVAFSIVVACNRYNADYLPPEVPKPIPPARP